MTYWIVEKKISQAVRGDSKEEAVKNFLDLEKMGKVWMSIEAIPEEDMTKEIDDEINRHKEE